MYIHVYYIYYASVMLGARNKKTRFFHVVIHFTVPFRVYSTCNNNIIHIIITCAGEQFSLLFYSELDK